MYHPWYSNNALLLLSRIFYLLPRLTMWLLAMLRMRSHSSQSAYPSKSSKSHHSVHTHSHHLPLSLLLILHTILHLPLRRCSRRLLLLPNLTTMITHSSSWPTRWMTRLSLMRVHPPSRRCTPPRTRTRSW